MSELKPLFKQNFRFIRFFFRNHLLNERENITKQPDFSLDFDKFLEMVFEYFDQTESVYEKSFFRHADLDGDGVVSLTEFITYSNSATLQSEVLVEVLEAFAPALDKALDSREIVEKALLSASTSILLTN
jgi:Ca2+-binding EF-hand superfamily protein